MQQRIWVFIGGAFAVAAIALIVFLLTRPGGPPLGDVALEDATPPGSVLVRLDAAQCHADVPGWNARGTTDDRDAVIAWFTETWGPHVEPWTARANTSGSVGEYFIFDDLTLWFRDGSGFVVSTFDTVDHTCPPAEADLWDLAPTSAWAGVDTCGEDPNVGFVGELYGRSRIGGLVVSPPLDEAPRGWSSFSYPDGQTIHYTDDADEIVVRTTASGAFLRYTIGGCLDG